MSDLNQRTQARLEGEAAVSAVNDGTSPTGVSAWPELAGDLLHASPDKSRPAVPAFPLPLLPQPWRDWAGDAARSSAAPVDYVVQAMLAAVAGIGGRRVLVIPTPGWQEPLKLWLAAVGGPATGKSPALAALRCLLVDLEDELAATGGGDKPRRQIVLDGRHFERIAGRLAADPRGMVLWRDGPQGCLAPFGIRQGIQDLEPAALSIVGSIDPDRLDKAPRSELDTLAGRFLYAWPQPLPFQPLADRTVLPSDAVVAPLRRIAQLCDALQGAHGLFLDDPAAQAFDAFRARLHEETRQAEGLEQAWLGKGGGAVVCLAGAFALMSWSATGSDGLPSLVGLGSVERAIALWCDYYRPHARAFLARSGPTDPDRQVRRVMRWLASDGRSTLSREDVRCRALGDTVNASEAQGVIERLVETGVLRPLTPEPGPKGGRPALRWEVNPLLTRSGAAQTSETSQT